MPSELSTAPKTERLSTKRNGKDDGTTLARRKLYFEKSSHLQHLSRIAGQLFFNSLNTQSGMNQLIWPLTFKRKQGSDGSITTSIGGCDIKKLIEKYRSPLLIMDVEHLQVACRQFTNAVDKQIYPGGIQGLLATKALSTTATNWLVKREGFGVDVISLSDIELALKAGISPDNIYFHGNNKNQEEIIRALTLNCTIIIDSLDELRFCIKIAKEMSEGTRMNIQLRIKPDIGPNTHPHIQTGKDTKFGIGQAQLDKVFQLIGENKEYINFSGLHAHIGSQITELNSYKALCDVMVRLMVQAKKHNLKVKTLNMGGGLAINYGEPSTAKIPSITEWVQCIATRVKRLCKQLGYQDKDLPLLMFEPGRSLVGPTCITVYTVGAIKSKDGSSLESYYLAVDGGMGDNARSITFIFFLA